ncbi:MAG TPA: LamG domain-containing protein [Firmicutes bacterium]|nr:LamG domain-containing protein [Bacillota bacterium]
MKQRFLWLRRGAALAAALALCGAGWSAAALAGYTGGRLQIVSEPGEESPYVHYYSDYHTDAETAAAEMTWSDDGRTGKALTLNGAGEALELEYNQLQMHTMTFAGWYYWEGNAGAQEEMYSQRLFTLSHSDELWLTVMPHARDSSLTDEQGRVLDGVFMQFYQGTGGEVTDLQSWNPAEPGTENYGLALNEWHHIALTMDGRAIRLYIDGRLWFEEALILGVEEMRNNMLTIGAGRWEGEPTFRGRIDDMAIYDFAMTAEQIALLNAGVDPLAEGAAMPSTTAPSLPTEPTEASTSAPSTTREEGSGGSLFGLPAWTVNLIAVLLVIFIGLSILLSVYQPPAPPKKPPKGGHSRKPAPGRGGAPRSGGKGEQAEESGKGGPAE